MARFVPGDGPINSPLMIVGEAPGFYEDESGLPFQGPSGSLLNKLLRECGINRSDIYVTNVVKYRPPENDFKRIGEVCNYEQQLEILINEIKGIQPNCILALGAHAAYALTGNKNKIKDLRGSILKSYYGPKVVCTYHPAALLRSDETGPLPYWIRNLVKFDINRALEESTSSYYDIPNRNIIIANSSADIYNFFSRHTDSEYLSIDIEALKCIPSTIAFSCNPFEAIALPLFTKLFKISLTSMPHSDLAECWKMIAEELSGPKKKIGQNFKYDQDKLERLGFRVSNFYHDTMLAAGTIEPEFYKGLGFLTSIYTKQPYYKDEGRDFNPKKDDIKQLLHYNGLDACITLEIALEQRKELEEHGLLDFYYNYVHLFHDLYMEMENRGLVIDYDKRKELKNKYQEKSTLLMAQMKEVLSQFDFNVDKFNPSSPKQVGFALYDVLKVPRRKGTGEDILFALLANTVKDERRKLFIRSLLDYRKSKKTETTYISASPDYDGRMKTSYRIVGTETGRSSTSVLDPPVRPDKIGIALQTMTKHGDIGSELRSQYVPDPGKVFVEVDLSQAEPRIVALLSKDDDLLGKFGKIDIHSWTAELMLGIPMEEIKKGSGERHIGKTGRNAGNYNVGKREFMLHCNTMAAKYEVPNWQDISEYKAGQLLDRFHQYTPNVRGIFHEEIRKAISETRVLINPFGRRRTFWNDLQDDKIFKEGYAFLPQSTVRDQVGHAMIDAKKECPEIEFLLEMHDALMFQCWEKDVDYFGSLLVRLLERPIDFANCTLSRGILHPKAEVEVGYNWKDLKSYKLRAA